MGVEYNFDPCRPALGCVVYDVVGPLQTGSTGRSSPSSPYELPARPASRRTRAVPSARNPAGPFALEDAAQ
jgi:hypothetical protein